MLEGFNRTAEPVRRLGRPPKERHDVEHVIVPQRVNPHKCPFCGKGQAGLIENKREKYSQVSCRMCGKKYLYFYPTENSPAKVAFT